MQMTSLSYGVFLCAALALFCAIPQKFRASFLLLTSYGVMGAWDWRALLLLMAQTLITYCGGQKLYDCREDKRKQRNVFIVTTAASFSILFVCKYNNFFNDSFKALAGQIGIPYVIPHLDILLPLGISFYTFQSFSYVMDIRDGRQTPVTDIQTYALAIAFFPSVLCGPISRPADIIPSLQRCETPKPDDLDEGVKRLIWGIFKKVVIADRLAAYVTAVYRGGQAMGATNLLLASFFFTIQIYADFSGYSDIAIGSARLFGIRLRENFSYPYFAITLTEFWKKWHQSLTQWFRNYLYIPLGGNRVSMCKWLRNVMIVFCVSGLWHGASWSFVLWGCLHGAGYLAEAVLSCREVPKHRWLIPLRWAVTFLFVDVAWIFFRAGSWNATCEILRGLAHGSRQLYTGASQVTFVMNLGLIALFFCMDYLKKRGMIARHFGTWTTVAGYAMLLVLISLLGVTERTFIYLQF